MDLIADTNAIVGELLRARGRALLAHPELAWFTTEEIASAVHHEVCRRVGVLTEEQGIAPGTAATIGAETVRLFDTAVRIVPRATYTPLLTIAATRIVDPDDRATVALALAMGAGIWTLDRDFFGIGPPVWSTDVQIRHLVTVPNSTPSK